MSCWPHCAQNGPDRGDEQVWQIRGGAAGSA